QNHDGTMSTYIQIQYTGSASDFSWILPLPHPIGPEDIEVPEDAMAAFTELEVATDPVFIPPPLPRCVTDMMRVMAMAPAAESADVMVHATGEVGPYGFDVISSEDPDALVNWLREHDYRVTPDMEPLIDVYVEEEFAFLAMRLLPDQGAQDVQPIKITYPSEYPMIPLRLTAVAANANMAVMVWVYADKQAVPMNYAELQIPYEDITFTTFGGSNYRQLIGQRADDFGGQGFITEYAAPTRELAVTHPLLQELRRHYAYVTRLNTVISPEEMTVDPVFDFDPQRKDVSNIHDLSNMTGLFDCEREQGQARPTGFGSVGSVRSAGPGPEGNTRPTNNSPVDPRPAPENNDPVLEPDDNNPPVNPEINTNTPSSEPVGGEVPAQDRPDTGSGWPALALAGGVGALFVLLMGGLVVLGIGSGKRAGA
ncbi:MAG: DUF2330 domain-containing protein, partial [Dehalococcoidia bacterium]